VWDVLKIEMLDYTIMHFKNILKLNRHERQTLEKELNVKLAKRDNGSMNVEYKNLNDHINLLEIKLKTTYKQKVKGVQVRTWEQWVELGEKNNSYFLGLEKKRQIKVNK
jgi:hypothetical protein